MKARWAAEILDKVMVPSFKTYDMSTSVQEIIRRKQVDSVVDLCMSFCDLSKVKDVTEEEITKAWKSVFHDVWVTWLGFSESDVDPIFDELVQGDWGRLHLTDAERNINSKSWLDMLEGEVFYCSDRWGLDRLTRCHWIYRQYVDSYKHEKELEGPIPINDKDN